MDKPPKPPANTPQKPLGQPRAKAKPPKPPQKPKGTKTERLARAQMRRKLRATDYEGTFDWYVKEHVPEAWHTLEEDIDVEEPKVKITRWVDRSVAQFYRAMGKGYQARINRVLTTYAQLKIANITALEARMREEMPAFFEGGKGIVKTEPLE